MWVILVLTNTRIHFKHSINTPGTPGQSDQLCDEQVDQQVRRVTELWQVRHQHKPEGCLSLRVHAGRLWRVNFFCFSFRSNVFLFHVIYWCWFMVAVVFGGDNSKIKACSQTQEKNEEYNNRSKSKQSWGGGTCRQTRGSEEDIRGFKMNSSQQKKLYFTGEIKSLQQTDSRGQGGRLFPWFSSVLYIGQTRHQPKRRVWPYRPGWV